MNAGILLNISILKNTVAYISLSSLQQVNIQDLVPALVAAEQKAASSLHWRVHEKLLQCYSCLPRVISGDQIYFRFFQRMFSIITTNVNVLYTQTCQYSLIRYTVCLICPFCLLCCRMFCQSSGKLSGHYVCSCAITANKNSGKR